MADSRKRFTVAVNPWFGQAEDGFGSSRIQPREMFSAAVLLALATAQGSAGAARDVRPVAGAAAIDGRVTEQSSGRPLPRIVVSLSTADRSKTVMAITDADGRYRFSALAPGKYFLWAASDAHRSTYLQQRYGEVGPASLEPSRPNVELKADEVRSGADMALARALAIEGRVLDPWGEPMAEVEVNVTRADGRLVAAWPVATDDLGAYRLYGLPPGRYRVCAKPRGRFGVMVSDGARFVSTCHPTATVEREATDVVLASADASDVDIRVQRVGSYSISGSVIDAAGISVDDADVGAYSLDESGASAYARSRNGEFTLKGLTPGRYIVSGTIGGSLRGDPNPPSREKEAGYAWADVGSADTTGIVLMLTKPVAVTGRITFDGGPAPRADRLRVVVQISPPDYRLSRLESRPPFAAVDDNLRFEVKGLYRMPLAVGVQGLPDGWVVKAVRLDGRDITHVAVDFAGAATTSPLEIVLTNRVARPLVRVTDDRGLPVTLPLVVAMPADPSRWRLGTRPVMAKPALDGALKLEALLPGDYFLAALPSYEFSILMRDPGRVESLAAVATRVRIAEGQTGTIDLRLVTLPVAR